jgi:hypothetical protein
MKFNDILQENETEYQKAKIESDKLNKEARRYADIIRKKYPVDARGVPSNETLQSKEYKQDRLNFQKAFNNIRAFNKTFVNKFKKEIRDEYNK